MRSALAYRCLTLLVLTSACNGDSPGDTTGDTTGGTTSETTTMSGAESSTGVSGGETTSDPSAGTTTGDASSETAADGSSTGPGCTAGTEGCACNEGDTCEDGLFCVEGECVVGAACDEQTDIEPNDDEATAVVVEDTACNAVFGLYGSVDGTDTDWFGAVKQLPADNAVCSNNPYVRAISTYGESIEICIYYDCADGTLASFGCTFGTETMLPDGTPGCCGTENVETQNITCPGAGQAGNPGTAYFEVRGTAACVDYEIAAQYY